MTVALGVANLPVGAVNHQFGLPVHCDGLGSGDRCGLRVERGANACVAFDAIRPRTVVCDYMHSFHSGLAFGRHWLDTHTGRCQDGAWLVQHQRPVAAGRGGPDCRRDLRLCGCQRAPCLPRHIIPAGTTCSGSREKPTICCGQLAVRLTCGFHSVHYSRRVC